MAMRALDLEPGDEVICPSINFRAGPLSIIGHGGTVVFAEIDPNTLNLDPNDVEKKVTPRTRAILPTHMNGLSVGYGCARGDRAATPAPEVRSAQDHR